MQTKEVKAPVQPVIKYLCPHCKKDFGSQEKLEKHWALLVEMKRQFQSYIMQPPVTKDNLYGSATSGDAVTIGTWYDIWLKHLRANNDKYDFEGNSAFHEYKKFYLKPCIIAGSGPSLKNNAHELKKRGEIGLVSALHNYAYFEDNDIYPDYYVNLDAGNLTISEVIEGGKGGDYWETTKGKTLISVNTANPGLLDKWQGKILFFGTAVPDQNFIKESEAISKFFLPFSTGGNVLGASLYFSKAILASNPIAFVGADFAFDYAAKFHPFDSQYDQKFSGVIPGTDVFGNRVHTWPSYHNFKCYFDWLSMGGRGNTPGHYFNCTEGGTLGAYYNGNIINIRQETLANFLGAYTLSDVMEEIVKKKQKTLLF